MDTIYIDKKNTEIEVNLKRLQIKIDDEKISSFPLIQIKSVVILTNCKINTNSLNMLSKNNINVFCLNHRNNNLSTVCHSPFYKNPNRRLKQYNLVVNSKSAEFIAREILKRKVKQHKYQLELHQAEQSNIIALTNNKLAEIEQKLDNKNLVYSELLGLEGFAAKEYFATFITLFPKSLNFSGRNKRPPKDPVNVILSLTYTLIHYEAIREILAASLDPMLGFLHKPNYSRESLACDLVELVRASANEWIYKLFHQQILRVDHFSYSKNRCILGKAGREIFYPEYHMQLDKWKKRLKAYIKILIDYIDEVNNDSSSLHHSL